MVCALSVAFHIDKLENLDKDFNQTYWKY